MELDFKTPIGICEYCGQTEYLVPYYGSYHEICGCDVNSYFTTGSKIELPLKCNNQTEKEIEERKIEIDSEAYPISLDLDGWIVRIDCKNGKFELNARGHGKEFYINSSSQEEAVNILEERIKMFSI